jgi:ABC-type nitrate/sulfonate/bicarbonate transport system ATPase subunit
MKNHLLNSSLLLFNGVTFYYDRTKTLINNAHFHIKSEGEITCLLGSSGSGKSTIIKLATDEVQPSDGVIQSTSSCLVIFQDFERMILPWFKVKKNIIYGSKEHDDQTFKQIVSMLEIEDLLDSYPNNLSGGQKQRMIFARALLRKPKLLIMDEPLSSIDIGLSKRLIPKVKNFLKANKISALWVTHDAFEAINVSDKILVISGKGSLNQLNTENISQNELLSSIQSSLS